MELLILLPFLSKDSELHNRICIIKTLMKCKDPYCTSIVIFDLQCAIAVLSFV